MRIAAIALVLLVAARPDPACAQNWQKLDAKSFEIGLKLMLLDVTWDQLKGESDRQAVLADAPYRARYKQAAGPLNSDRWAQIKQLDPRAVVPDGLRYERDCVNPSTDAANPIDAFFSYGESSLPKGELRLIWGETRRTYGKTPLRLPPEAVDPRAQFVAFYKARGFETVRADPYEEHERMWLRPSGDLPGVWVRFLSFNWRTELSSCSTARSGPTIEIKVDPTPSLTLARLESDLAYEKKQRDRAALMHAARAYGGEENTFQETVAYAIGDLAEGVHPDVLQYQPEDAVIRRRNARLACAHLDVIERIYRLVPGFNETVRAKCA